MVPEIDLTKEERWFAERMITQPSGRVTVSSHVLKKYIKTYCDQDISNSEARSEMINRFQDYV